MKNIRLATILIAFVIGVTTSIGMAKAQVSGDPDRWGTGQPDWTYWSQAERLVWTERRCPGAGEPQNPWSCRLLQSDLSGANLTGINLSYATMQRARLVGTNLTNANLYGASLKYVDFSGANLSGADLRYANLIYADLAGVTGIPRTCNTVWTDGSIRSNSCDTPQETLTPREVGPNFPAVAALPTGCDIVIPSPNVDWHGCDRSGWYLWQADLRGANLSGANLSRANVSSAILTDADLSHANLFGANFFHTRFGYANLTRADLRESNLTGAFLSPTNLTRADLSYANMRDARMISADLTGANLSGADLTGVEDQELIIFSNTTMPDGSIRTGAPASKKWKQRRS